MNTWTYDRDGLELHDSLLPEGMIAACLDAGKGHTRISMPHRANAAFLEAMRHKPIVNQVRTLIGDAAGLGSDFYATSPELARHQDSRYVLARPEAFCSVWIALTDCGLDNGCLEVVLQSHKSGLLENIDPKLVGIPLTMRKGQGVIMHGDLIHGSRAPASPGKPRQALLLTYIRKGFPFRAGELQNRSEVPL
jgi:ectoine hydroxylase-related dioxygenase (phytanoyl-CoA dioxygenase family)